MEQLHYRRYEVNVSDHRPVSAAFRVTVKKIRHEVWEKRRKEVEMKWVGLKERLLREAREFYASQALL